LWLNRFPSKSNSLNGYATKTDPFELAKRLEQKLERIFEMANSRITPSPQLLQSKVQSMTPSEKQTLREIAKIFATQLQK